MAQISSSRSEEKFASSEETDSSSDQTEKKETGREVKLQDYMLNKKLLEQVNLKI